MAISHFRSAHEHFKRKSNSSLRPISQNAKKRSCETAMLIFACYKLRGENRLAYEYLLESKKCFRDWVTGFHIHYPCGKSQLYYIESNYDEAKQEILKFGLNWPYYRPDYGFFEGIWNQSRCIKELHAIFDEHINGIIKQYDDFSNQLLIE